MEVEQSASGVRSFWKYSAFIVAAILIVGAFVFIGKDSDVTERAVVDVGDSPSIGIENAPVKVVLFSDFSCPYCAAASGADDEIASTLRQRNSDWMPPVPGIINDYVNSGKVRFVFKYYPGHGSGQVAHIISLCLNEQDLFWEFHDKAFANYESTGDLDKMLELAEEVGADMEKVNNCIANEQSMFIQQLSEEMAQGREAGVQGTPTFFVNGIKVEGAVSYSDIRKVIDSELSE